MVCDYAIKIATQSSVLATEELAPSRGVSQLVFSAERNLQGARSVNDVRVRPSLSRLQDLTSTTIPIRPCLPPGLHEADELGGVLEGYK
jgi:hypothetical protein